MNIFITGATGFIGTHLVQRMAQTEHKLRCLVKTTSNVHALEDLGITLVTGNVTDKDSLLDGMKGCDWVINLANIYSWWEPNKRTYTEVNVEGTRNVMECALKIGISKVIHISSIVIYGKPTDCPFTEESPAGPIHYSEYAKTKYKGDLIAWNLYKEQGLPLVMIYPGAVLGVGDSKSSGQYIKNIIKHRMPAKILPDSVLTYVHVKDVAEAIVKAAEKHDNIGEKYFVCSQQLSVREYNDMISGISGISLPKLTLPSWIVMANATLLTSLANLIKKQPLWQMSKDMIKTLKMEIKADGRKAERELGITYTPIRNALEETITKQHREEDFFHRSDPAVKRVMVGSTQVNMPIKYYRDDCFLGFFSTAYESTQKLLPSKEMYPVRLPNGRAVLGVAAFNYLETSIGPYGEISIFIPCTLGSKGLRGLPLILEGRQPGWGLFVLHLPVTTRLARDAGRVIYGYPKFVADMHFERHPTYQGVNLSENGKHILTLAVQQRGLIQKDNRPIITYSDLDGSLLKTTVHSRAIYQMGLTSNSGRLTLGDHKIADQLRDLDISTKAFVTRNYLTRSGILPAAEVVGQTDRPYSGYIGKDLDYGRLAINYDHTCESIQLHACKT